MSQLVIYMFIRLVGQQKHMYNTNKKESNPIQSIQSNLYCKNTADRTQLKHQQYQYCSHHIMHFLPSISCMCSLQIQTRMFRMNRITFRTIASHIKEKYRTNMRKDSPVTFREFVQYIIDPRTGRLNRHFQPFHQLCEPCRFHFDFIGHYETMAQDGRYVLNRLGIDDIQFPQLNVKNSSHHVAEMFSQLKNSEIRRLSDVYRLDFELFGYSANISEYWIVNTLEEVVFMSLLRKGIAEWLASRTWMQRALVRIPAGWGQWNLAAGFVNICHVWLSGLTLLTLWVSMIDSKTLSLLMPSITTKPNLALTL